jgi:hypothetical protein
MTWPWRWMEPKFSISKGIQMQQIMMCWTTSFSLERRRSSFPSIGMSDVYRCGTMVLTIVKSFMLSVDFARSLKKDRSNSSLGLSQQTMWKNTENVTVEKSGEILEHESPFILNADVTNFRAQGFSVDDNNEPPPKNVPTVANAVHDGMYEAWGSEILDAERVIGVKDVQPTLASDNALMHNALSFFLHYLPLENFKATISRQQMKSLWFPSRRMSLCNSFPSFCSL